MNWLGLEAIGAIIGGVGAVANSAITLVFYRELTSIERARSIRETNEYTRREAEKASSITAIYFQKRVADFVEEISARASEVYPIHEVMMDLSRGDPERRRVALAALEKYLQEKEKVPSERESLRQIVIDNLLELEPEEWTDVLAGLNPDEARF